MIGVIEIGFCYWGWPFGGSFIVCYMTLATLKYKY